MSFLLQWGKKTKHCWIPWIGIPHYLKTRRLHHLNKKKRISLLLAFQAEYHSYRILSLKIIRIPAVKPDEFFFKFTREWNIGKMGGENLKKLRRKLFFFFFNSEAHLKYKKIRTPNMNVKTKHNKVCFKDFIGLRNFISRIFYTHPFWS